MSCCSIMKYDKCSLSGPQSSHQSWTAPSLCMDLPGEESDRCGAKGSVWDENGSLTDHRGLQVHQQSSGNVSPEAPCVEEGVEGIFTRVLLGGTVQEDAVRTDAMLEAQQLPACISRLDAGLAHMDGDALSLWRWDTFVSASCSLVFFFRLLPSSGVTVSSQCHNIFCTSFFPAGCPSRYNQSLNLQPEMTEVTTEWHEWSPLKKWVIIPASVIFYSSSVPTCSKSGWFVLEEPLVRWYSMAEWHGKNLT